MDTPIVTEYQLTKKDLCWHFLYYCYRALPWRLLIAFITMSVLFFMLNYTDNRGPLPLWAWAVILGIAGSTMFAFMYLVDLLFYWLRTFILGRKYRDSMYAPIKLTFEKDRPAVSHKDGEGSRTYESLMDVHVYKRHGLIKVAPNLFQIVPLCAIAENRRIEFINFLKDLKKKLKEKK